MQKKVLITGVAGFIGSTLADRLIAEGYTVVGIDNLEYGLKEQISSKVEFYQQDIRSKQIYPYFVGVDTVFHLAAKNCISDCQKDPVDTADVNVVGTVNVFEAARRAGVRKVIYAESSAIYEGSTVFPTPEDGEEKPKSFYADSKFSAHLFAQSFIKTRGMNMTALRYFNVFGPRQDYRRTDRPIITEFIIQLLTQQTPILYGGGRRNKDYIYVDDINDFHLLAMNDDRTNGQTYNLGSGVPITFKKILALVQKCLETTIEPKLCDALQGGVSTTVADISKALALGWKPKTSLEEGIKQSIAFIKEFVIPRISK